MATNNSTPYELTADDGTIVWLLCGRESVQFFLDDNATPIKPTPTPRPVQA